MSGARIRCAKKHRTQQRLRFANEGLPTLALVACRLVLMTRQWPHGQANQSMERLERAPLDELRPTRAEIHIGVFSRVRNSSPRAGRELATSLEMSRQTVRRDNKLSRRARDIFSCLSMVR